MLYGLLSRAMDEPRVKKSPTARRIFFRIRVSVLLLVLLGLVVWGVLDRQRRVVRTEWERSLDVAIVLIQGPTVSEEAFVRLKESLPRLELRLSGEFMRHVGRRIWPFRFHAFGPVPLSEAPPEAPDQDVFGLARFAFELWRFSRSMDKAAQVPSDSMDTTLYVIAEHPKHRVFRLIEGLSQQGGRAGVATVELDEGMVDFALFVATHELFHTLGASDKYDRMGHTLVPDGLGEPDLEPVFPQRCAEVMARNRALTPTSEAPPLSLDELCVGPATAREIGWAARAPVPQRSSGVP